MSVRVSTRGVRTSVGPRIARVSVGSGGTRLSSGLGPFFASTSVGGSRRRTTTARRSSSRRATGPSLAQLQRAQRAAEREQREAERDARIAQLQTLRHQSTTVHLQGFPIAQPPLVHPPPALTAAWARAEADAFYLRGVGRFARAQRAAARDRAAADAPAYLAAEQTRLARIHHDLSAQATMWWQQLVNNDEATVCEAVNTAFADNPAAGCAVGLHDGVLSVVMRHQDLDTLPTQTPGLTAAGRPTLKTLTKRDRSLWWLTILGSNLIATVKEAVATAPAITAVDLAVLTRIPDTQRLDVIVYGRWTRHAIDTTPWRRPEDALRFLDIGEDVSCAISTTTTKIKPIDTSRVPGLQRLVDTAIDDGLATPSELPPSPDDPYTIVPFEQWAAIRDDRPPHPAPQPRPPQLPSPAPTQLHPGQNLVLPDDALPDIAVAFTFTGADVSTDADLTVLLLGADQKVRHDEDFLFYNQPVAAGGAARLLGKTRHGISTTERASLRLAALPHDVHRIVVAINMDVDHRQTCAALQHALLHIACPNAAWTIPTPRDPEIRAMILAEIYRHPSNAQLTWKLRAVGQGWADGLSALARDYGVDIE